MPRDTKAYKEFSAAYSEARRTRTIKDTFESLSGKSFGGYLFEISFGEKACEFKIKNAGGLQMARKLIANDPNTKVFGSYMALLQEVFNEFYKCRAKDRYR